MTDITNIFQTILDELKLVQKLASMEKRKPSLSLVRDIYHNLFGEENVVFDSVGCDFENGQTSYCPRIENLKQSELFNQMRAGVYKDLRLQDYHVL
jgi:hypothetical protein